MSERMYYYVYNVRSKFLFFPTSRLRAWPLDVNAPPMFNVVRCKISPYENDFSVYFLISAKL